MKFKMSWGLYAVKFDVAHRSHRWDNLYFTVFDIVLFKAAKVILYRPDLHYQFFGGFTMTVKSWNSVVPFLLQQFLLSLLQLVFKRQSA